MSRGYFPAPITPAPRNAPHIPMHECRGFTAWFDNTADIPFALLYVLAQDGKTACLAGSSGLVTGTTASPLVVELAGTSAERFDACPLEEVIRTGQGVRIDRLPACLNTLLKQNGDSMPRSALVLPISRPGQQNPYGILVAGISPLRILDDDYRSFFELVVGQVANAIAKARAYQEARERAEALAALDRAKTDFFSNVSHEFRTPLTLILGPVEDALADTDHLLLPDQRERLEIVRRNGLRLLKLVNTLLDFSRVESERIQAFYRLYSGCGRLRRNYQTQERVNEWIAIRRSEPERAEVSGCDEFDGGGV